MSEAERKGRPRLPRSRLFHERLISLSSLDNLGFREWLFLPGMLFGSFQKWWGDLSKRRRAHEGLDMRLYRSAEGNIKCLTAETRIPVLFDGHIVKKIGDFLGESVFVSHGLYSANGCQLYTMYGHIKPSDHIRPGKRLSEGDIVGVIADTGNRGLAVPPHLHISVAWISNTVSAEELGWRIMSDPSKVALVDPLSIIVCPYSIILST